MPLGADALSLEGLVQATGAAFVAVYVTSTAAGVRLLDGAARWAAGIAFAAVLVVLAFSGPYLLVPAAVAVAALTAVRSSRTWPHTTPTEFRAPRALSSACE